MAIIYLYMVDIEDIATQIHTKNSISIGLTWKKVKSYSNSCIKFKESKAVNRKIDEVRPLPLWKGKGKYIDRLYIQIAID